MPRSRFLIGSLPWYSVLILTGAALAIWLTERLAKRESLPPDTIVDLALRVLPAGILGARIYYVLFSWDSYRKDPLSVLRIWEGGLAIYGGILAGLIVILIFCRRRQLSVLTLCDLIVPGLALAQAIGRWGNYFNMEAYGWTLPEHSALCFFPAAVLIPEGETAHWHLATFFYESICDFGLFLALLALRRRFRPVKGQLFRFYVFCYAAVRLVIEVLRMDSLYSGTVRVSQLLSLLAMALLLVQLSVQVWRAARREGIRVLPLSVLLPLAGSLLLFWPAAGVVFGFGPLSGPRPIAKLGILFCFSAISVITYLAGTAFGLKHGRTTCQPQP